jgi:hypothetical protein
MKRALLLMMGGAIALLVATAASAVTTSGKVVATDALTSAITIETDDGRRLPFTMNDATKVEHEGMGVALADLREDSQVTVTTEQTPTDPRIAMLATRVQVEEMAIAAPVSDSESAAGTVRVESAGADGDRPVHTAQVQSADYGEPQRPAERLPKTATPLPLD